LGAFDNVPSVRLSHTLLYKGVPQWFVNLVLSFTQERRTRIAFPGYTSPWIPTREGIPQGSPLSPILFLFFISELLEQFDDPAKGTLGFGFVDDTNLIAWGDLAKSNCKVLSGANIVCKAWAQVNSM
jgi:Reverse transcriptase (RNA-dependent DNA polymerase)